MQPRAATPIIRRRLRSFPAVAIVGPRQCGKTTLARALGGEYFDLEQETDRLRLDLRWDELTAGRRLMILDEAQVWPAVFPRLRGAIDGQRRRNGRFLLLGSVAPSLMRQMSESLAGRLALVELSPFLIGELPEVPLTRVWLRGGYPDGGVLRARDSGVWHASYLDLLCQRDLPNWGLRAPPGVVRRLVQMTAAWHGQPWNASRLAQSLGVSYHTVNAYADYLEGAYLLRRLPLHHVSLAKRLTKTPKAYLRDSGLLHALLGASTREQLLAAPWVGASWEGFVIEQLLAGSRLLDPASEASFLRTSDGVEIDLLLLVRGRLLAIDIKLTSSPSPHDLSRLRRAADLVRADHRYLVSMVRDSIQGGDATSCNLPWLLEHLGRQFADRRG
jgi:hypothetical protein